MFPARVNIEKNCPQFYHLFASSSVHHLLLRSELSGEKIQKKQSAVRFFFPETLRILSVQDSLVFEAFDASSSVGITTNE